MAAHHLDNPVNFLVHMLFKPVEVLLRKRFLDTEGPVDLVNGEDYLAGPFADPLLHVSLDVVNVGFLG